MGGCSDRALCGLLLKQEVDRGDTAEKEAGVEATRKRKEKYRSCKPERTQPQNL